METTEDVSPASNTSTIDYFLQDSSEKDPVFDQT